jgi:hypothetical protein
VVKALIQAGKSGYALSLGSEMGAKKPPEGGFGGLCGVKSAET